jgi:hypothetical protein
VELKRREWDEVPRPGHGVGEGEVPGRSVDLDLAQARAKESDECALAGNRRKGVLRRDLYLTVRSRRSLCAIPWYCLRDGPSPALPAIAHTVTTYAPVSRTSAQASASP